MLYFAYGSNLDKEQMKKRCPDSSYLSIGSLENYQLVYDGFSKTRNCAVANVVSKDKVSVWGAIFDISQNDLDKLDIFEGYPKAYDRAVLNIKTNDNSLHQAIVYFRTGREIGVPSEEYRNIIIKGAKDSGLPSHYIEEFI